MQLALLVLLVSSAVGETLPADGNAAHHYSGMAKLLPEAFDARSSVVEDTLSAGWSTSSAPLAAVMEGDGAKIILD